MSLNARKVQNNGGGKRTTPSLEPGGYPCRLVQVLDLGVQPQRAWEGEDKPPKHEVCLTYELLDEFMLDDEGNEKHDSPRWIWETITFNSLDSDMAKSTKRYYALDPKEDHKGDWEKLLGLPAIITIVNKPNKKNPDFPYENVAGLSTMRPKEADKAPELVNKTKFFSIDSGDKEMFMTLPQWMQDKIKEGLEFEGTALHQTLGGESKRDEPVDNDEDEKEDW